MWSLANCSWSVSSKQRMLDRRLRQLPWGTAPQLAGAIALVLGGPLVVPGAVVPRSRTWSPRALASALARMAVAAPAAVLVLGWLMWCAVAGGPGALAAGTVALWLLVLAF